MTENLTSLQQSTMNIVQLHSKDNPITGANLANRIGLKPRKDGKPGADMRAIVHALRVKGYPICASGDGYWWPASSAELSVYIASFGGRVLEQEKALKGLQRSFDKLAIFVPSSNITKEEAEKIQQTLTDGGTIQVTRLGSNEPWGTA